MLFGFDHREKFVLGVKAGEYVPGPPVEESFLPDVDVKKAQGRSERQIFDRRKLERLGAR